MPVNICYPLREITLLNKKRFENILRSLPKAYLYEISIDYYSSLVLDIKGQPKEITTTRSYLFGQIKKTRTEIRQYTIAHVVFEKRGSGWGRVSGTRLENAEVVNFINKLSQNWINSQGKVEEITINIIAPPPASLAFA